MRKDVLAPEGGGFRTDYSINMQSGDGFFGDMFKVLNPAGLVAVLKGDRKAFLKQAQIVANTDLGKTVGEFVKPGKSIGENILGAIESVPSIVGSAIGSVAKPLKDAKSRLEDKAGVSVEELAALGGAGKRGKGGAMAQTLNSGFAPLPNLMQQQIAPWSTMSTIKV